MFKTAGGGEYVDLVGKYDTFVNYILKSRELRPLVLLATSKNNICVLRVKDSDGEEYPLLFVTTRGDSIKLVDILYWK